MEVPGAFAGVDEFVAKPSAPEIDVADGDLSALTERAIAVLEAYNDPPQLFRQGGSLVRVGLDEHARPFVQPAGRDIVRQALAKSAGWLRSHANGKRTSVSPPKDVVENVIATPELPLPALRGIVTAAYFNRDGEFIATNGYNRHSALYLLKDLQLGVPSVPLKPSAGDVAGAVAAIDELLADFPFATPADRCHAFALLLGVIVREMIDGPLPLHLVDAPAPGTGKTLLLRAALLVACGVDVPIIVVGRDEEEMRKRITSLLLAGRASAILDNLRGKLDASALAAVLTADWWEDRALSTNCVVRLPNRAIWAATANNVQLSNEIARRTLPIRLDAGVDRPFDREGFRHPNLLAWARENRIRLLGAGASLVQSWITAGRPGPSRTLASFESWSAVVGGILNSAGIVGFLENRNDLLDRADEDTLAWRAFTQLWNEEFGVKPVSTSELLPLIERGIAIEVGSGEVRSRATKLGKLLARNDRRVFGPHRVERGSVVRGIQHWHLTNVDDGHTGRVGHSRPILMRENLNNIHIGARLEESHTSDMSTNTNAIVRRGEDDV